MIPQFVLDMTEAQRKEHFRLQEKIKKIKEVAKEINEGRKSDLKQEIEGCEDGR